MASGPASPIDQSPESPEPGKHSLGVRILAALGFSFVGAKIGFLGMIPDVNAVLGGAGMTLGEKFRGVFNKTLSRKLGEKIETLLMEETKGKGAPSVGGIVRVSVKVMKYSTIATGIGIVGGALLGWARGGRIEDWKDIFKHPWRSTKLILGLEQPPEPRPLWASRYCPPPSLMWRRMIRINGPVRFNPLKRRHPSPSPAPRMPKR